MGSEDVREIEQLRETVRSKDNEIDSLKTRVREMEREVVGLRQQLGKMEVSMHLLREEASRSLTSMVDAHHEKRKEEVRNRQREGQLVVQVSSQAEELQHIREQLLEEAQAHREDVEASQRQAKTQVRKLLLQLQRAKGLGKMRSASQPDIPSQFSPSLTLPPPQPHLEPTYHQPLLKTVSEGLPPSYQQSSSCATVQQHSKFQKAPVTFHTGVTAFQGHMCYFSSFMTNQIHSYDTALEAWQQLPACPVSNFGLQIVKNLITTIGGRLATDGESICTTQLFSLTEPSQVGGGGRGGGRGGEGKWVEIFPPMILARAQPATASDSHLLIVAGGEIGDHRSFIADIDVLLLETYTWCRVSSSPLGNYSWLSAVLCREQLYLVEGYGAIEKDTIHCLNMGVLIENIQEYPAPRGTKKSNISWRKVTPAPASNTTCVCAKSKLVAVGGIAANGKMSNEIWAYNESSNKWKSIGRLKAQRYRSLVCVTATGSLLVIGGLTKTKLTSDMETFDSF